MQINSNIESVVMRRVHHIRAIKLFFTPIAFAAAVLVLSLWGIGREVWVAHVIQNFDLALRNGSLLPYLEAAFLNTRFTVQALTAVSFAAMVWLAYSLIQAFRSQFVAISLMSQA